jgi:hypothetical protein
VRGVYLASLQGYNLRPGGAFTQVAAEGGPSAVAWQGSLERVSATTLAAPAMWRISDVYSAT